VTRALVNVDFGPAMILGSGMVASGLALYQVRAVRPEVSKDYDIMFASVALLCGGILIFQGWRLDPLLLFGQILTAAAAVTFAAEAVKLRGQVNEDLRAEIDREREGAGRQKARNGGLPGQEGYFYPPDYDAAQGDASQAGYTGDYGYQNSSDAQYSYYSSSGGASSASAGSGDNGGGMGGRGGQQQRGYASSSYMDFETEARDLGGAEFDNSYAGDFRYKGYEEGRSDGPGGEGEGEGSDRGFSAYDVNSDWE